MKALDLRTLQEVTWEVTLLDGSVIHIQKPNQELRVEMESLQGSNDVEMVTALPQVVLKILNNNKEKAHFTHIPKGMDLHIQTAIVRYYTDWLYNLMTDPN